MASEVAEVDIEAAAGGRQGQAADEDALVAIKCERAVEEAVRYMDTSEGKAEIKMRARNIERKRNEYKARTSGGQETSKLEKRASAGRVCARKRGRCAHSGHPHVPAVQSCRF